VPLIVKPDVLVSVVVANATFVGKSVTVIASASRMRPTPSEIFLLVFLVIIFFISFITCPWF
jgi:high-affinity K+ transport system ATPase subunit B